MKLLKIALASSALVLAAVAFGANASSATNTFNGKLFEFVGNETGCVGTPDSVSASWMTKEGLADAGKSNHALMLTKSGASIANCASSGVSFRGEEGMPTAGLGFWVRDDGWCGAGAPRFNLTTNEDGFHFVGCAAMDTVDTMVDPQGNTWIHKQLNNATAFPPVAPATTIRSLSIVFDEGTDVGPGFTWLDNITIGGFEWGKPGNAR